VSSGASIGSQLADGSMWTEWAADRVMRRLGSPLKIEVSYMDAHGLWQASLGPFFSSHKTVALAIDSVLKLALDK
jgi:hypothetical protein